MAAAYTKMSDSLECKDGNAEGDASTKSSPLENESLEGSSSDSLQNSASSERPEMFTQCDPVIDAQNENEPKRKEALRSQDETLSPKSFSKVARVENNFNSLVFIIHIG